MSDDEQDERRSLRALCRPRCCRTHRERCQWWCGHWTEKEINKRSDHGSEQVKQKLSVGDDISAAVRFLLDFHCTTEMGNGCKSQLDTLRREIRSAPTHPQKQSLSRHAKRFVSCSLLVVAIRWSMLSSLLRVDVFLFLS